MNSQDYQFVINILKLCNEPRIKNRTSFFYRRFKELIIKQLPNNQDVSFWLDRLEYSLYSKEQDNICKIIESELRLAELQEGDELFSFTNETYNLLRSSDLLSGSFGAPPKQSHFFEEKTVSSVRMDVVHPEQAQKDFEFALAVALMNPESKPIQFDRNFGNLKSTSKETEFELLSEGKSSPFKIEILAPSCNIQPESYLIHYRIGKNSPIQYFHLVAQKAGNLYIIVNGYQKKKYLELSILTTITIIEDHPEFQVYAASQAYKSRRLGGEEYGLTLYLALRDHFSLNDMKELAFLNNIDWENISGDTKDAKARSLVEFFGYRMGLRSLEDQIKRERPNLDLFHHYRQL